MKGEDWPGCWKGQTVVCIASGPSLTEADCEAVKASGLRTIVTNTTFKLCPWADVLFAFDTAWLKHHRAEWTETFNGRVLCHTKVGKNLGATPLDGLPWYRNHYNSGANAIGIAAASGAAKVVLLGYDCQRTGGKTHWHGDHPKPLGNASSIAKWPKHFEGVAKNARQLGAEVVNCSRETGLTCFPRMPLEQAL
jgi:hypothetical protein